MYTFFFNKHPWLFPSPQICLFLKFLGLKTNLERIPVIFQHSLLMYRIPLAKDHTSFYEISGLAICIRVKAFNLVNRKQKIENIFRIYRILYCCLQKMIQP